MYLQFSHGLHAAAQTLWNRSTGRFSVSAWNTCHGVTQWRTRQLLCLGAPLFARPGWAAWHDESPKHTMRGEGWEGTAGLGKFLTTWGVTSFPTAAVWTWRGLFVSASRDYDDWHVLTIVHRSFVVKRYSNCSADFAFHSTLFVLHFGINCLQAVTDILLFLKKINP